MGITIIINNLQQPRLNTVAIEGFYRCEQAGEGVSNLENKKTEIIQPEELSFNRI